jgi:hypothetical protein
VELTLPVVACHVCSRMCVVCRVSVVPPEIPRMTWGVKNSEKDAHEQLDYAIKERGINFIDTAEVYPGKWR